MNIVIRGELKPKISEQFLYQLNDVEEGEEINIYIDSVGGLCYVAEAIQFAIDELVEKKRKVTLIGMGNILSAAFTLFFNAKGNKKVTPGTVGMIHMSSARLELNEDGKITDSYEQLRFDELRRDAELTAALVAKLKLPPKDVEIIKNGGDLWFNDLQLKQLIKECFTHKK